MGHVVLKLLCFVPFIQTLFDISRATTLSTSLSLSRHTTQAHKDLILNCLDDKDESIRLRALDLVYGMVTKKNLMECVKKLMVHMDRAEGTYYRDELLAKIIQICSQNNYQHIINFEWSDPDGLTRIRTGRVVARLSWAEGVVPSVRLYGPS